MIKRNKDKRNNKIRLLKVKLKNYLKKQKRQNYKDSLPSI